MEEFQKWENIKQKQEAGNTSQKREVSSQNGRVQVSDTLPGGFPALNSCWILKIKTHFDTSTIIR